MPKQAKYIAYSSDGEKTSGRYPTGTLLLLSWNDDP
jgi:hypothetical protein